ncbi:MAG: IS3 family transposase [Acidimicrobiia bacterium]|nr:IS3 family transposase [Acidimicrobiia bacterium]
MTAATQLATSVGCAAACRALDLPRASFYRARTPRPEPDTIAPRSKPARALCDTERQTALMHLHSERFVDQAPHQVHASLLDEGIYVCSPRTMYRLLEEQGELRERRDQLRHPAYQKPELLATRPNQVWSWDITKLRGPVKWTFFYLYVILDLFSRYVVGWMVAPGESAELAKKLIQESLSKQGVSPGQVHLHADNGPSMTSKTLALKLADLGVTKSHSRPYVSDDNPFSESQFKTMKYRPQFPDRFGSLEDARVHGQGFFHWYNLEHHHSGIAMLTPHMVHYGLAADVLDSRQRVLTAAFQQHPERFVRKPPRPAPLPDAVWINPPKPRPPEGGETH